MILAGPNNLLQTIYHEESPALLAVSIDETTGKIATASSSEVYVYRPYGKQEGHLKVTEALQVGCGPSLTLLPVVPSVCDPSPR